MPPNAPGGLPHFKIDEAQQGKPGAYSQAQISQASLTTAAITVNSHGTTWDNCKSMQIRTGNPSPRPGQLKHTGKPALAGLGRQGTRIKLEGRTLGIPGANRPPSAPLRTSQLSPVHPYEGVLSFLRALATPQAGMCAAVVIPRDKVLTVRDGRRSPRAGRH